MAHSLESSEIAEPAVGQPRRQGPGPGRAPSGLPDHSLRWWTKAHWYLLLVALVLLILAGRGQHFFYDEWAFVGRSRDALPLADLYLLPHNEHWSTLPLMVYRMLGATVGVGSYWPYLGLLLLLHLGVTHVLWRLMLVTGSKPIVATALAAVFSVLGAAAEDLVWAFQIGFVGSTLLGLSAIHLAITGGTSRRRTALVTGLITASLAASGVGLAYLIVVPMLYPWRRWRHAIVVLGIPLLTYVTWYAMYGHSLTHPPDASATLPLMLGAFVILGLTSALARFFGFEMDNPVPLLVVGAPALAGLTLACRDWVIGRRPAGRTTLAMCAGAVGFFGSAGLARAGLGLGSALAPRYVYVAVSLLLPGLALVISSGTERHPRLMRAVVPLAIVVAVSNSLELLTFATEARGSNNVSRRVLVAGSELLRSREPVFADQRPEPQLAPDLTTTDLRSGRLDAAFDHVSPKPIDRLTASLNLQVRVALVHGEGTACSRATGQRIVIATSRTTAPAFQVSAGSPITFTLRGVGSGSAQRVIDLPRGTYQIYSLRNASELTIRSTSPPSLLASCRILPQTMGDSGPG